MLTSQTHSYGGKLLECRLLLLKMAPGNPKPISDSTCNTHAPCPLSAAKAPTTIFRAFTGKVVKGFWTRTFPITPSQARESQEESEVTMTVMPLAVVRRDRAGGARWLRWAALRVGVTAPQHLG